MTDSEPSDERSNDLQTTVCANGVVNVRNQASGSGDVHSIFVGADGDVLRCSCRGHKFNGHCYHADAIEARPLILSSATAAGETYAPVATDGGQPAAEIDADATEERNTCEHDIGGCPGPYHHDAAMCADCLAESRVEFEAGVVNPVFGE